MNDIVCRSKRGEKAEELLCAFFTPVEDHLKPAAFGEASIWNVIVAILFKAQLCIELSNLHLRTEDPLVKSS